MSVTLRNGKVKLPLFGLGTWLSAPEDAARAVKTALEVGYTLIDTAALYQNEEAIGRCLQGLPRESFHIVTKLHINDHPNAEAALRTSLKKLGLDFVDVYLIHAPRGNQCVETWKNMLAARDKGLAKAVGVSNFGWKQIEELKNLGLELPEVNQIELHVWNQQREDVAYLKENEIAIMGYCPLARGKKWGSLGGSVSEEVHWAIRWSIEKGYVTIPKTVTLDRVRSNFEQASVPLSADKIAELDAKDERFKASNSVKHQDLPWDEVK